MDRSKRAAASAAMVESTAPGQTVTFPVAYDVSLGTAPSFVKFDTVSRYCVKFDTGGAGLGSSPVAITFKWRKYGNPSLISGNISVGIRKASGDTFSLIAEYPVGDYNTSVASDPTIRTAVVGGSNSYVMVANDKVSIEFPANATNGIEIAVSTTEAYPTGYTSQKYVAAWANTTSSYPLAATIKTQVLT
jgi:hypothetical protein